MRHMITKTERPANQTRLRERGAVRGWIIVLLILVVGGGGGWFAVQKMKTAEAVDSSGGTVAARRGDLNITVTEGGSIRAHKSVEYRCQVESRGMSSNVTILSIVPAGTYITQEDVDNGKVLVELDSSAIEDRLIQEELSLNSDKENATATQESYNIQITQNESSIAKAEMQVRFALMDLQKYLGKTLTDQMVTDVNQATNLSEYVGPFIRDMEKDPNLLDSSSGAGQEYKRLRDDITLAKGNLNTAEATLAGTQRLFDANYVSFLDLQRDELTVDNRKFAYENAEVTLKLFLKYDFPKNTEQQLSNYIESLRNLHVTQAECRSSLAQAQVRLSSAQERFKRQEQEVDEIHQQMVVYGTGGSEDTFRMMRGRGGGGSGIIAEGETVSERQVLISMPDTKSMIAEIGVHETDVDKVQVGQPALIVMDAFPDKQLAGHVLEVAPLPDQQRNWMNPDLKVYQTLINIDGTHDFLKSRMSCKVEILVRQLRDVVLVPIQVVANRGGRKVCYVVTSTGTEERVVTTGAFSDTLVQIVDGLEAGEEVLLNPPMFSTTAEDTAFQQRFQRSNVTPDNEDSRQETPAGTDTMAGPGQGGMQPTTPGTPGAEARNGNRRSGQRRGPDNNAGASNQPNRPGGGGRGNRRSGMGQGFDMSNMTPEQRQAMQQRMRERLNNMTPEQQQQLERFRNMSDEERQQMFEQMRQNGSGGFPGFGGRGNRANGNNNDNSSDRGETPQP